MKLIRKYIMGLLVLTLLLAACMGDGNKQVVSTYLDGSPKFVRYISLKDGDTAVSKEIFYYQNGKKRLEGSFDEDGLYHGSWTGWYFDGRKNYEAFNSGFMTSQFPMAR